MNPLEIPLPYNHQQVLNRFVAACQVDERVIAAFLVGSYAKGTADTYSDLDLYLLTSDEAYEEFCNGRATFIQLLGEPLFLEDFNNPNVAFFIFADGTEGELTVGRESQINHIFSEPYQVLLDKKNLLAGAKSLPNEPEQAGEIEPLRRQVFWFWHDLSHFIVAMGRGQLWWAYGQLEILRGCCVNLVRLRHNLSDGDVGEESYFKVEQAIPTAELFPLRATFCPMEPNVMYQAALIIVHFFQETAVPLAQAHGIIYPAHLERVMVERLEKLGAAHLRSKVEEGHNVG